MKMKIQTLLHFHLTAAKEAFPTDIVDHFILRRRGAQADAMPFFYVVYLRVKMNHRT